MQYCKVRFWQRRLVWMAYSGRETLDMEKISTGRKWAIKVNKTIGSKDIVEEKHVGGLYIKECIL